MYTGRIRACMVAVPCVLVAVGCSDGGAGPDAGRDDADGEFSRTPVVDGGFVCRTAGSHACIGSTWWTCERSGEFLRSTSTDCRDQDDVCVEDLGCVACKPGVRGCRDNRVTRCTGEGTWRSVETCDPERGTVCRGGSCRNLCDVSVEKASYVGCEFFAADLDNAAIGFSDDASSQQYAVVVSNPGNYTTEVSVELDRAGFGKEPNIDEVARTELGPGDLEVFELDRREVDGSSSNARCFPDERACPPGEVCVCSADDSASPCFCRVSENASGLNDGTHTAVTSRAYRIRSTFPVIAYQFNPLQNSGVFSNDASLMLPTSALTGRYSVVGWPQTIADGPGSPFDSDLKTSLTIIGTAPETNVRFHAGEDVGTIVGAGPVPRMQAGDELELTIGPFDVVNLETDAFNADFTGSRIEASKPVTVFTGSEASDVPRFDDYGDRQCCADHLEEQLFPDRTLGSSFVIARMPSRTKALNRAFADPDDRFEPADETEWVRVVATKAPETVVRTTLPEPDDRVELDGSKREHALIEATEDFRMWTEDGNPIAVLQALPSEEAVGIPNELPGGDPAILAVPPEQQWRQDYVFLTPGKYAFDFLVVTAPRGARIRLDGEPLSEAACTTTPLVSDQGAADAGSGDAAVARAHVVHRCQLSFPQIEWDRSVQVERGEQRDGVHTVVADVPVGLVVFGFDDFVSYAYVGGLDLEPIVR